eukprot:gene16673-22800_t
MKSSISLLIAILLKIFYLFAANKCVYNIPVEDSLPNQLPRWAIVALARPGRSDLMKRNKNLLALIKPFATSHNITIIIFSEKKFPVTALESWKLLFNGVATVRLIDTYDRGFNPPINERFGYKYMCKFFSLDIYDYLKDQYDYYLRCDTDCYMEPLSYDLMKWAEDNNLGYGFALRKLEAHKPTRETLPPWTIDYMKKCQLIPTAVMDHPIDTCFNFYNNFHIGKVSFFNRPDVRHYLESVNSSGHILSHRWGDSTIQAYAVRLFMNPKQIIQVPNFSYVHGSHGEKRITTHGDGSGSEVPQRLKNWKYSNT